MFLYTQSVVISRHRRRQARGNGKRWQICSCKRVPTQLNRQALRKLYILNAALAVENLAVPPGNRLDGLRGDRAGQHSIRINDRYRICFVWRDGNAYDVEVVDYH